MKDIEVKQADQLVDSLAGAYKSLPHLPKGVTEFLVTVAPWLALIFGILGIIAGLGAVGLSPVAVVGGVHNGALLLISGVVSIISSVLTLLAFPKLQKRQMGGWKLLAYSELLNIVGVILTLSVGSIISGLIGAAIGFYILFEMKSSYK